MEFIFKIAKFRDPNKGNWEVNLSGGYENITGKAYDFESYVLPNKRKDNPEVFLDYGKYMAKAELTGLIKGFKNPITQKESSMEKIEVLKKATMEWMVTIPPTSQDSYFEYVARSAAKDIERAYKEEFGVEIILSVTKKPEDKPKQDSNPSVEDKKETQPKSTGIVAKYISTGASNNGVPMEITYEIIKDGTSVYKSQMTTGFKYDEKTKKITISAAETFYDMNGKWVDKNGKDPFVAKDMVLTLQDYPPQSTQDGTSGTSGTSGVSGNPKIYGEFVFDVQEQETFSGKEFGRLEIIHKGALKEESPEIPEEEGIKTMDEILGDDTDEYAEEYVDFESLSEEQKNEVEEAEFRSQDPPKEEPIPTAESTANLSEGDKIDFSSSKFVGGKWKSFDIEKLIAAVPAGYKPNAMFKESLKKVLHYIKNDAAIDNVKKAAYLLGTAFAESSYSLQRWESDYVCNSTGIKYGNNGPCKAATDYYKKVITKKYTKNGKEYTKTVKSDYYKMGTDSKGFPYFGRGLIQLTGKANYTYFGKLLAVDLVGDADLAMVPENSYKIAREFMKVNGTFKAVLAGDLTLARKTVNGGNNGIKEVNGAYNAWLNAINSAVS